MPFDVMEKNNIIVGKHCMELSEVIISLRNTYDLVTTDLSASDSLCVYPTYIKVICLSTEEMLQFISFFHNYTSLQKIGFSESSLLFLAQSRRIKVAVMDKITQDICKELDIETIKIERRNAEISEQPILNTNTRTSKLNILRIAACL